MHDSIHANILALRNHISTYSYMHPCWYTGAKGEITNSHDMQHSQKIITIINTS